MIKVLINNEEVVSNHNLEIKEEMLSTSSTILKNCYPKVWENDKDYVSRYYYPKDYSKCKIYNLPRENTTQEQTGTNLSFETYIGKSTIEDIKFYGNTLQNGTPTPSYPQTINSVTGLQNIEVCGKNLFNKQEIIDNEAYLNKFNVSNLTTNNSDISWEATGNDSYISLPATITGGYGMYIEVEENTQYTLSFNSNYELTNYIHYIKGDYTFISRNNSLGHNSNVSFTTPSNCRYIFIRFGAQNQTGNTINITNIQIEKGSTATSYEEYKGNTYEVNLGKNLFDKDNASVINAYFNTNGVITNANTRSFYIPCKPNTTYTVQKNGSARFRLGTTATIPSANVPIIDINNNDSAETLTITTSSTANYLICYFYATFDTNTKTLEQVLNTIQVEVGSQATSYSPYFTPIELNKIGNYQDYIRKSTGKNLFDKDNVENNYRLDSNGDAISSNGFSLSDYIEVKPNTTYTISRANISNYFNNISEYSNDKTHLLRSYTTATTFTITTQSTTKYIRISDATSNLNIMQLEQGNVSTDLEPYGVGKWYKYSAIGKVVLDGSENWTLFETNTNTMRFVVTNIISAKSYTTNTFINNRFTQYAGNPGINPIDSEGIAIRGELTGITIRANISRVTDLAGFKNWLSSNNTTVYYVLATPQVEVITNEELINQLESLNIELYEGQTNFIINGSLPMPTYIKIYNNFEELIFCGFTKNTGNVSLNPREFHGVDLQILDFKDLLSTGETLNYVIANKTITEAINQVVNSISDYGFVVGEIQLLNPDETIGAYSTLNKTAYDVFQYFAEITQSRWTTRLIDENTIAIDFYDPSLMPTGVDIDKTQTFYENYKIIDMSFNYSTNDYRNKQIMTSDEVYANITQTETIIADGYATSFMCQNKIGLITSITLNGVSKTFATKSEEQLGITADFIYQPGETTFTSNNLISAGGVIVITYYPIVKGREIILNNTESDRIESQINRNGTISRYENRNDTTSSQELQKIGQSYIKYKGNAEINLKIVSELNTWNVGEIVSYNAPISELSTTYMVKSKQISMYLNANKIIYTYNLTSNYNCENAVNYFDNQRSKNQGNIGEGETITRNIDLDNEALILFYDKKINEVQVQNPTSLDFALDGVLI